MTKQTKQQNRAACKRAVNQYVNGQKNDARETAKRVSWAFLFNWMLDDECKDKSMPFDLGRCEHVTNGIKGKVEIY